MGTMPRLRFHPNSNARTQLSSNDFEQPFRKVRKGSQPSVEGRHHRLKYPVGTDGIDVTEIPQRQTMTSNRIAACTNHVRYWRSSCTSPNQNAADGPAPRSRFHLVLSSYSGRRMPVIAKPDYCESIAFGCYRDLTRDCRDLPFGWPLAATAQDTLPCGSR